MYEQGVPEDFPAGVYVFYAYLQNYYLSVVALLHQWLSWAGRYLMHYGKTKVHGYYFQSNYIWQYVRIVLALCYTKNLVIIFIDGPQLTAVNFFVVYGLND